ncbi:MAG: hypothetical protein KGH50_03885, partial [Candidatus Micrarchaeota archaeon]|nr:hypothetical protein [Candidatus Micrarchaeota archaeon]
MALRVPNRAGFRKPVMIAVCLLLLLFSITAVTHLKLRPKLIETPAPARSATTALSISTAQQPTTQTPNWSYSNANPVQGKTGGNPIRHIIVIFQENRAFDNYFGTYPGAYGIQSGACVPIYPNEKNGTCVKPFRLAPNQASTPDLPHLYKPSLQAMDNGKMDGFIAAAHGCNLTMGYYDSATIPYYWDYARHFVLADHTFQSMVGYSPANHWAMIAALAPLIGFKDWINSSTSYATRYNYTVEADSIPTLTSLMSNSKVSWKYYDQVIPAGKFQQAFGNG